MRDNANTIIEGRLLALVPYKPHHVAVYNTWMQDPYLQDMTASEPLSLEEEYDMQRSWAEDADKLTFIVLDRSLPDTPGTGTHGGAMAGDVNLFFGDEDDRSVAEIEVMVAEPASRRKGLAREALRLLVAYSAARLGVRCYVAKIRDHNEASMRLFEGLGFREVRRVAVFKEVHYELYVGEMGAGVAAASAGGAGAEGEGEGERGGPGGEGGGEPAPPPPPAWVAEEVAALKCTTYEGG